MPNTEKTLKKSRTRTKGTSVYETPVNTEFLETLIGYNARRATLVVVGRFVEGMSVFGLRPTEFSVLSLIAHNPGITSSQLSVALTIQPPNLVTILSKLDSRSLIARVPHPTDGRALGLELTEIGATLSKEAHECAVAIEKNIVADRLTVAERARLMKLLAKLYRS